MDFRVEHCTVSIPTRNPWQILLPPNKIALASRSRQQGEFVLTLQPRCFFHTKEPFLTAGLWVAFRYCFGPRLCVLIAGSHR